MSPVAIAPRRAQELLDEAVAAHRERNPRSAAAVEQLGGVLPGGDTRSTTWYEPFPVVIAEASGTRMRDLDGHELIDLIGNYTALVHGHLPHGPVRAAGDAVAAGTVTGAPMPEQGDLARRLAGRVDSVDLVRFANSGTEANLLALRIARAATGRRRAAVARHSYHGSAEALDYNRAVEADLAIFTAGDADATASELDAAGELAAIFVEPVLGSGGVIPLSEEYLGFLRAYAERTGALLVFDEVMTLRLDLGGRQETVGVRPDLTTFGKLIGGGLPIGAVGGRERLMALTDPRRPGAIAHSGTFNGNRAAMAAGAAALAALDRDAIAHLDRLGEQLAAGLEEAISSRGLPLSVTACGSMMNLHSLPGVATADDAEEAAAQPLKSVLHLWSLEEGLFIAQRGEICANTAMDERTVDDALAAFGRVFDRLAAAV